MTRTNKFLAALWVVAAVAGLPACGGGGDSGGPAPAPVPPPPPPPSAPTAAFTAPTTVAANAPAAFDASASAASNGGALIYSWDFGNGRRGGGVKIAQLFPVAGTYAVTLTVVDGTGQRGTQTQRITVTPPAAPPGTTSVLGLVKALDGSPLAGASATVVGASTNATSDAAGKLTLAGVPIDTPVTIKLSKGGYADQFVALKLPAVTGASAFFDAVMRPREAAQTLPDAARGGDLVGKDGARITLPAGALVDGAGTAVQGAVQISLTPVDITQPRAGGFPGRFEGVGQDGSVAPIVSFGTVEFTVSQGGRALQLAPGRTATIELPLYARANLDGTPVAAGNSVALWSLDEATGAWINEGSGTVVASATSPTGFALRATAGHLSWWNADKFSGCFNVTPSCGCDPTLPAGFCDSFATETICNMIGEIDRGLGNPLPGFAASTTLPMAGGVGLCVPPDVDVRFGASAAGGAWFGQALAKGASGQSATLALLLRPVTTVGSTEVVALPFLNQSRTVQFGQISRFNFAATASQWARVRASAPGGAPSGRAQLLNGSALLAAADFGPAPAVIVTQLPATATYSVDITAAAAGTVQLSIEVFDADPRVHETITPPFDQVRRVDSASAPQLSFAAARYQWIRYTVDNIAGGSVTGQTRVVSGATTLGSGDIGPTPVRLLVPANGTYAIEIAANTTGDLHIVVELLGGAQDDPRTLPFFDGLARTLAPFTTARTRFDATAGQTLYLVAQGNPQIAKRLLAPDGTAVLLPPENTDGLFATVTLPQTGSYTLEQSLSPSLAETGTSIWTSAELTHWKTIAPPLDLQDQRRLFDVQLDRNGALVIGYSQSYTLSGVANQSLHLRRWDGTGWVTVGADLLDLPLPCNGSGATAASLAFDAANRPLLAFTDQDGAGAKTNVRRFDGVQWAAVGGGILPNRYTSSASCSAPVLRMTAADVPVIAYSTGTGFWVQKFDGTQWSGMAGNASDFVAANNPDFDMALDATQRPVRIHNVATSSLTSALNVARFDGTAWQPVGPANGVVPVPAGVAGQSVPKLRIDAAGAISVGAVASLSANLQTFSAGSIVYRFDGTQWSSTGGFQPGPGAFNASTTRWLLGFGLLGGDGVMAWLDGSKNALVIYRNAAAGWSGVGAPDGLIPQFYLHGRNSADATFAHPVVLNGELHLVLLEKPSRIQLLRFLP